VHALVQATRTTYRAARVQAEHPLDRCTSRILLAALGIGDTQLLVDLVVAADSGRHLTAGVAEVVALSCRIEHAISEGIDSGLAPLVVVLLAEGSAALCDVFEMAMVALARAESGDT